MYKINFNLNEYQGNFAMHCPKEWQAELFCKFLHDAGKKWLDYDSYIKENMWRFEKENTVYYFNEGLCSDLKYAKHCGYKILKISDFIIDTHEEDEYRVKELFENLKKHRPTL